MDEPPKMSNQPNLLLNSRIEREVEGWRQTGIFPFPEMKLQSTQHFLRLSLIDLRLVHHLGSIYRDMRLADFVGCAFWVQEIPRYISLSLACVFRLDVSLIDHSDSCKLPLAMSSS